MPRPAGYRRRGSGNPPPLERVLEPLSKPVNRRLRSRGAWSVAAAASVPVAVALTATRKRIGMHPAITLAVGCVPPLGLAITVPKGRRRYLAVAAGYLHLLKLGWELPSDDIDKLRRRLWIDTSRSASTRSSLAACRRASGCSAPFAGTTGSRSSTSRSPRWASPSLRPSYGAIGWTYVASATFAVVYLGEHYVADVLVGLLVEAVRRADPLAAPFVRAVARAVE